MQVRPSLILIASACFVLLNYRRLALPSDPPELLRFAHTFTTASERAIINDAIVEFESLHPGTRIEQRVSNSEVYNNVGWRLQLRGRSPPNIYFHWDGFKTSEAIQRGWALDLTPYLSPGFIEQFVSAPQKGAGTYFLPQSFDLSNLVWFNQALFDQLSLQAPNSLPEWFALCQRLRSSGHLPLAQGNRDLWPMGNFAAELLAQSIGPARSADLFQPHHEVTTTEVDGLRTLAQMRQAGWFDFPGVLEPTALNLLHDVDAKVLFLNGKSAQHIVGSWFVADIQDAISRQELPFPVGIFPIPPGLGETDATVAVATGYLVHPSTPNPRVAVAFLELLLSRKYQVRFAQLGHLSGRRDAAAFISDPLSRRLWEILAASTAILSPPDTGFRPEQAATFYRLCARLLGGKIDPAEAARVWSVEKQRLAQVVAPL